MKIEAGSFNGVRGIALVVFCVKKYAIAIVLTRSGLTVYARR